MKSYKVYVNGKLIAAERAKISVFDAAFLYGEGLFETLLAINGRISFLADHLQRLSEGARSLHIPLPLSSRGLEAAIYKTLRANRLQEAYVRVNLSAEEADVGRRQRRATDAHLVIFAKPAEPYPARLYRKGARLVVIQNLINDPVSVATIKTTNYLAKMLARREVSARKADEGILLNAQGHVTECAGSNFFIVKRGRLLTPRVSDGVLPGVTRKWILKLARQQRIPVQEKTLTMRRVEQADEVFITSTLKGVMPVAYVGRRRVGRDVPGQVTAKLTQVYRDRLMINSSR
jgi:branched-chain amino acid aminotransferase